MARRRHGIGLVGLLIIGAILYFSGAGSWLWNRVKELDGSCYALLQELGTSTGDSVCAGMSRVIAGIDEGAGNLIDRLRGQVGQHGGQKVADMGAYTKRLFERVGQGNGSLAAAASSGSRLRNMMQSQPIVLPSSSSAKERLRTALDQFVIGQHYLQQSSPGQAIPWLRQSAQQPGGYGLLSQMTLGDMYRSGSYGISPDRQAARYYYEGAQRSISQLSGAHTTESQQLLSSLPAAPHEIARQIGQQIQQLKR